MGTRILKIEAKMTEIIVLNLMCATPTPTLPCLVLSYHANFLLTTQVTQVSLKFVKKE